MARLIAAGRAPSEPVAVVERGTTARQRVVVGTIADIAERARAADVAAARAHHRRRGRTPARAHRLVRAPPPHPRRSRPKERATAPARRRRRRRARLAAPQSCRASPTSSVALARLSHARTHRVRQRARRRRLLRRAANAGRDARSLARRQARRRRPRHRRAPRRPQPRRRLRAATAAAPRLRRRARRRRRRRSGAASLGAHDGRRELADALAGAGWTVEPVAAYDSVPDDAALAAALEGAPRAPVRRHRLHVAAPARAPSSRSRPGHGAEPACASAPSATPRAAALVAAGLTVDAVAEPTPIVAALVDAARALAQDRVDSIFMQFPEYRPRRLRRTESLRRLVRETQLAVDDFILSALRRPRQGRPKKPISSLPGISQLSVDEAVAEAEEALASSASPRSSCSASPTRRTPSAREAWNDEGLVQRATRAIKQAVPRAHRHRSTPASTSTPTTATAASSSTATSTTTRRSRTWPRRARRRRAPAPTSSRPRA